MKRLSRHPQLIKTYKLLVYNPFMHNLSSNTPTQRISALAQERLCPTAVLEGGAQPSPEVQQIPGFIDRFLQADIPSLGKSRDNSAVIALMDKIQVISQASGLALAKQLAILLSYLYGMTAERKEKSVDCNQLIETLSNWTPQEVAKKFLEFCNRNRDFLTKEDAWMLEAFPVIILTNMEAFGGIEAYLNFQNNWTTMMEKVVQGLERKS